MFIPVPDSGNYICIVERQHPVTFFSGLFELAMATD
jgi:hypothetical protein